MFFNFPIHPLLKVNTTEVNIMQLVPETCFSCFLASFSPLRSHISWLKAPSKNMLPKVKTYINEDTMENLNAQISSTLQS